MDTVYELPLLYPTKAHPEARTLDIFLVTGWTVVFSVVHLFYQLLFFLRFLFMYVFRKRESKERDRGRERGSRADSTLSAQPKAGLHLMTLRS